LVGCEFDGERGEKEKCWGKKSSSSLASAFAGKKKTHSAI
jgi:hypothetical protein